MRNGSFTSVMAAIFAAALFFGIGISGAYVQAAARPQLPDLAMNTIDGKAWSLKEQRGRVVVLNFWAT